MNSILKTLSLCLFIAVSAYGQRLDYVPGEIIVQFAPKHSPESLHSNISHTRSSEAKEVWTPIPNAPMNLYTLELNPKVQNSNTYLKQLLANPYVIHAQKNKILEYRVIPDDPMFASQWQYVNTGSNGGTIDADIDADEAWEITTGGKTSNGDDIVVCVIDDGCDINHEDMIDNIWINQEEIDGDSIDNDGNGYIDDMNGWNYADDSKDVSIFGVHGTPVAGIVGARGNNMVGVAGVNWDVKLMIIKQSSPLTESNVLQTYSYAYEKRKTYNQTNGEKGAFVVATNASWGIDMGNPEDSPIWCAFYDSLGVQGILNCGATANREFNIDETGDLPTGCSSDYLISVTNMNSSDQKVNGAGYGRTTIDLGAHGAGTFTVERNNNYGGFGGTSGATPHVAGAVGLLYSVPCTELSDIAKDNPGKAALLVKEMILNTVDELPGLDGITTARGRLNLANAVVRTNNLCDDFGDTYGFAHDNSTAYSLNITWDENKENMITDLRIRQFDDTNWEEFLNIQNPYTISNLNLCDRYEYQLRSYPTGETPIAYGFSRFAETKGCCPISPLGQVEFLNNELVIAINNIETGVTNELEYRKYGNQNWTTLMAENTFIISGIEECDLIEYRYNTVCSEFSNASPKSNSFFWSAECGNCTSHNYCDPQQINNEQEWIEMVDFNGSPFTTGKGSESIEKITGGYIPKIWRGKSNTFTLTPGYFDTEYTEYFNIFLDLNQDGEFTSPTELVYSSTSGTSTALTSDFLIDESTPLGITRMRIIMAFQNVTDACPSSSLFGEAEDYCVEISNPVNTLEQSLDNYWSINPNISNDKVTIELPQNMDNHSISVYDLSGRLIYEKKSLLNKESMTLDLNNWSNGTYIIRLNTNNTFSTKKIVKL